MGAVFKTVSGCARAYLGGFDSHTPPPFFDWGLGIADLTCDLDSRRWYMNQAELKNRTKQLALRVIRLVESLPRTSTCKVIGNQLLRSGTSVGANYRAACRAKSTADFVAKLAIVEEEADESIYWIELLVESDQVKLKLVESLLGEFDEIVAIVVSAIKTSKENRNLKSQITNPK